MTAVYFKLAFNIMIYNDSDNICRLTQPSTLRGTVK